MKSRILITTIALALASTLVTIFASGCVFAATPTEECERLSFPQREACVAAEAARVGAIESPSNPFAAIRNLPPPPPPPVITAEIRHQTTDEFLRVTTQCLKKNPKGTAALNVCIYNALIKMKDGLGGTLNDYKNLVGAALIFGQATLKQVTELLGPPEGMNSTLTQNELRVQFVYPGLYVYLTNGHVTAVQNQN